MDGCLTVQEVADKLRFTPQVVRKWIHGGKLRAFKVGRRYRIKEEELNRLCENGDDCKDETA